jgi:hypothetical protein
VKPIYYLSGFCAGTLPPTSAPLGRGVPLPERKPTHCRRDDAKLPRLAWAIEKHGLDPKVVAAEGQEDAAEEPSMTHETYASALERARANGQVI